MTPVELYSLLASTGLPVQYRFFSTPPEPPYVVYLFAYSSNFAADGKVYHSEPNYQVELYSKTKDLASEKLLEDLFSDSGIYWNKTEAYLDSEGLYQILYEI